MNDKKLMVSVHVCMRVEPWGRSLGGDRRRSYAHHSPRQCCTGAGGVWGRGALDGRTRAGRHTVDIRQTHDRHTADTHNRHRIAHSSRMQHQGGYPSTPGSMTASMSTTSSCDGWCRGDGGWRGDIIGSFSSGGETSPWGPVHVVQTCTFATGTRQARQARAHQARLQVKHAKRSQIDSNNAWKCMHGCCHSTNVPFMFPPCSPMSPSRQRSLAHSGTHPQ